MTDHHDLIAGISRAIRAWSIARTSTVQDAEDLAQDVLLAMLESSPNLREEGAFYGFMWSVAGNVYRQWAKRKARRRECELTDAAAPSPFPADAPEDVALLRRELTLLSRRYREATVLYYVRGMKTAEIAAALSVSQSMVKYLLFKARSILKEGMDMERNYGEQSYHPRRLDLRYWGDGPNHYYNAANTLLRQNILFACYNDALTAEEIALEIGVGLPYMEDDLNALHEVDLLRCKAGRYRTNIVIFTEDFAREAHQLIAADARAIADRVSRFIREEDASVRALGFTGCGMNETAFAWQMCALLLHRAVVNMAGASACPELPPDKWGVPCLCWGVEASPNTGARAVDDFCFGASIMENSGGDWVQCMDFPIVGPMVHHMLYPKTGANVFLDTARGKAVADLSENDASIAAELIRLGYVCQQEGVLTVNCPVYTAAQYEALLALLAPAARDVEALAMDILRKEAALLAEYAPEYLKAAAKDMAYFRLFDDAVSLPMAQLYASHALCDAKCSDILPTTYVVLHG